MTGGLDETGILFGRAYNERWWWLRTGTTTVVCVCIGMNWRWIIGGGTGGENDL